VRLGTGSLFVYAGLAKFTAPEAFADSIAAFHMLPAAFVGTAALSLPVFEVLTGACLLAGWRVRENALAAGFLSVAFSAVLIQARLRGLDPDCGCFGPREWAPLGAVPPLVRNAVLLAGALFLRRPGRCDSPVIGIPGQSR
jgi:uncharacterized membrane protein YphA (DoxX/SURF4 family)